MKSLIEKLKNLDKKVLIGVGVGVAVIVAAVVIITVSIGGSDVDAGASSAAESSVAISDVSLPSEDLSEPESSVAPEESEASEDSSQSEESKSELSLAPDESDASDASEPEVSEPEVSEPEVSEPEVSEPEVSEPEVSEPEVSEPEVSEPEVSEPEVSEPEISKPEVSEPEVSEPEVSEPEVSEPDIPADAVGTGTKEDPFLVFPDENMNLTTYKIPHGKSCYFGIYRVAGMYLELESDNAYIIYEGVKYEPKRGKISFEVVSNALASDAIIFEIGNSGSEDMSFKLEFSNLLGSMANPEKIDSVLSDMLTSLEAGDADGYQYKYYAEKDGKLRFYVDASEENYFIVTNNRNSAQRNFEGDVLTDENGNSYILLETQKGDEIIIHTGAVAQGRKKTYPAIDIAWSGIYE